MRRVIKALFCIAFCLGRAWTTSSAGETSLFDFEEGTTGWHAVDPTGRSIPLQTALAQGQPRRRALRIEVAFPKETSIKVESQFDWTHHDELRFKVFVPQDGPYDAQAVVYVKDGELRWYQTLVDQPLRRGEWTSVEVDISHRSRQWSFRGHYRPWDGYTKQEISELGIKFFSKRTYVGPLFVDDVSLASTSHSTSLQSSTSRLFDFRTNTNVVPRYHKFEITFELSRTYANPYDPRLIDVRGRFVSPSGKITVAPGFFYQDYIRGQERKVERLRAMGRSKWKVRFSPTEVGSYRYFVEINDAKPFGTRWRSFEAVGSSSPGYVRICRSDPNYFEFDNRAFFYPIGHNVCATFDVRNAQNLEVAVVQHEGTFAYERYFKRMAENGENLARIWLAAWAFSIEWTKKYDIHFHGLGRYNLENAWRLDYILDLAEKYGIYVMFTFTPHGEMQAPSQDESDWRYSPYNAENGGFLRAPQYFWTHPEARRYYEQKVRYILARWAYSPNVFAWEIFNEIDLADYYRNPKVAAIAAQWTGRTAQFIKDNDPAKHLVTSNLFYLHRKRWAAALWQRPELDFTTGHLFAAELPQYLRGMHSHMSTYNKIFFVTECGDTPFGQGPQQTEAYLHMAIWSSHVMPFAGVAMPWWWIFIDDRHLYHHFNALAEFAKGEDRRGKGITTKAAQILNAATRAPVARYAVECSGNKTWAVAWVYDRTHYALTADETKLSPENTALVITDLALGAFEVEIWDTYEGKIVDTRRVTSGGTQLVVKPLSIDKDVALKIKYVGAREDPQPQ